MMVQFATLLVADGGWGRAPSPAPGWAGAIGGAYAGARAGMGDVLVFIDDDIAGRPRLFARASVGPEGVAPERWRGYAAKG